MYAENQDLLIRNEERMDGGVGNTMWFCVPVVLWVLGLLCRNSQHLLLFLP